MRKPSLVVLFALLLFTLAVGSSVQAKGGRPLVLAWMGDGRPLSDQTLNSLVQEMARQQAHPDHIVFLVHGYSDTRKDSAKIFQSVSGLIDRTFRQRHRRVLVVGLQWHAALSGNQVPWKMMPQYLKGVARARAVGRVPMRQLILRLRQQYPQAQMSLYTHSLGCEVGVACAYPNLNYPDTLERTEALQPEQQLSFNEIVLAQADLDYDIWYQSQVQVFPRPAAKMLWLTVAPYVKHADDTLQKRALARGKPGATRFPRMTVQQYDQLFKNRAVLFDGKNLQQSHSFVSFFNKDRLNRIVDTAIYLSGRGGPKPGELVEMDKILALPKQIKPLLGWLDSPNLSSRVYALWRLEGIVDGGSEHFADETLDKVHLLMKNTPRQVWEERKTSSCASVRKGYWPTEAQMTAAGAPAWAKQSK